MLSKQPSATICCPLVPEKKNVYEFLQCDIVIGTQNCSNKNHPDTVGRSQKFLLKLFIFNMLKIKMFYFQQNLY